MRICQWCPSCNQNEFESQRSSSKLRDGWFMHNGCRISQPMVFPMDHPTKPRPTKRNQAGSYERAYGDRGCIWIAKAQDLLSWLNWLLCMQASFTAAWFLEQKSSVQEVIEAAGHLCIFLPKFHCELNFIEFFWVQSRNTCGSIVIIHLKHSRWTFRKLLDQFNSALRKWNTGWSWMEHQGWEKCKDAQFDVKKYGSHKYTSHRKASETVARRFDEPSLTN